MTTPKIKITPPTSDPAETINNLPHTVKSAQNLLGQTHENVFDIDEEFESFLRHLSYESKYRIKLFLYTIFCILGFYIFLYPFVTSDLSKLMTIPIVAIYFTWFHIYVAVKMCFYPVNFIGIPLNTNKNIGIGWQGIVPRKADKMAKIAVSIMLEKILNLQEISHRICPSKFSNFLLKSGVLYAIQNDVLNDIEEHFNVKGYSSPNVGYDDDKDIPVGNKDHINNIINDVKNTTTNDENKSESLFNIFDNFSSLSDSFEDKSLSIIEKVTKLVISIINDPFLFSIEEMVVDSFVQKRELLVKFFEEIGREELLFLEVSAIFMGILCSIVQICLFLYIKPRENLGEVNESIIYTYLLFGISGGIIGSITNYIALKMIFEPVEPFYIFSSLHKYFEENVISRFTREGDVYYSLDSDLEDLASPREKVYGIKIHGLFLQRQREVAMIYSNLVVNYLLNVEHLVSYISTNSSFNLVREKFLIEFEKIIINEIPFNSLFKLDLGESDIKSTQGTSNELEKSYSSNLAKSYGHSSNLGNSMVNGNMKENTGKVSTDDSINNISTSRIESARDDSIQSASENPSIESRVKHLLITSILKHGFHQYFLKIYFDYFDREMALVDTIGHRLGELPHAEFDKCLHPVFAEDEWILVCLGGVLGVVVGFAQVWLFGLGV